MSRGVLQAALAYAMWGLFPLYFHLVSGVAPLEIVLHRSLWSLAFVLVVLAVLRRWAWLRDIVRVPRTLATFAASALLLSANWLVYVWAVNNGRVVDSSLGYFITPLVNVLLGYFVLKERPRRAQWFALAIAAAGVLWLTFFAGSLPWVGLVLAATFGTYGLMRKIAPLGALEGLALETLLLAPLAAALLAWRTSHGASALNGGDAALLGLLVLSGPLTALPLLLFAAGARRIPLTTLGVLQYIGPTIQFALGVWLFREPFAGPRLAGFVLIWLALVIYTAEGWLFIRTSRTSHEGGRPLRHASGNAVANGRTGAHNARFDRARHSQGGDAMEDQNAMAEHWAKGDVYSQVVAALEKSGKSLHGLTVEDLAPVDHFHARGFPATVDLADRLTIKPGDHVLDIGCGIGGPARYIAKRFRCRVTGIDITPAFVDAGNKLTALLSLQDNVTLQLGDAQRLPYADASFDGAYAQHLTMNIPDRAAFFAEAARVLKPGAWFALTEHGLGPSGAPHYPLPWSEDGSGAYLVSPDETRALLQQAGFTAIEVEDTGEKYLAAYKRVMALAEQGALPPLGVHILLGANARDKTRNAARNIEEGRTHPVQVICRKRA